MAVIRRITGAETGGLEELLSFSGTPTAQASVVHTGGFAYQLDSTESISVGFGGDDLGNDYIVQAQLQLSDLTPAAVLNLMTIGGSPSAYASINLDTNGDILYIDDTGSTVRTVSSPPLTVDTWHFFEFHLNAHETTGVMELFIDDSSQGQTTGIDTLDAGNTLNRVAFGNGSTTNTTLYVDDIEGWVRVSFQPP